MPNYGFYGPQQPSPVGGKPSSVRLYEGITPVEQDRLRDEQTLWLKERKQKAGDAVESHGGTLAPLEFNVAFVEQTENRVRALERRLHLVVDEKPAI
jgi:hypothetical protein